MVVASAVLAGGLAAGSGAASAAPAGSLLPAESVAAGVSGSMEGTMFDGLPEALRDNPVQTLAILMAFPFIVLGSASQEPSYGPGL
ncbi:hypothetical protein [Rhodococcus sp. NPDC127528]|uniref:hypothetical protein n=1 Tax=unclassified Rhodococcus (in: high G+C Gram-positive bacteria) TaxID=192944 RepID=UPI00362724A0